MKKILAVLISVLVISGLLAGCMTDSSKPTDNSADTQTDGGDKLKVALMLNGSLGDLAFFDSANEGLQMAIEEYDIEGKVFEAGFDRTKWESTLYDIASDDWDVIITGTFDMVEIVSEVALEFPEKDFIHYDASLDFEDEDYDNVYCMEYLYNEGAFLAGYLSASITETDNLGAIGAMSIPAVNDYLVGYVEGARHKNPDIKMQVKYTDSFTDSAVGMELASVMYNSGADIVANGAAISGLGIMDAAAENGKFVIGSDSDQALLFEESDPAKAETIITSVMKRIDLSLVRALGLYIDGKLPFGTTESLGMAEDAIQLADNKYFQEYVPEELQKELEDIKQQILDGDIDVPSAFGMTNEDIDAYITN